MYGNLNCFMQLNLFTVLTIISVCCFPKNVKGVVKVRGGEALSSPYGPGKSSVVLPYWNNCVLLSVDDTGYGNRNDKCN